MFTPIPVGVIGPDQKARKMAAKADRKAEGVERSAEILQAEVERLFMITEALWTILKEHHGYSDGDLEQLVTQIDLRDGKLDGKVAASPHPCAACGKPVSRRRPLCIYCGAETPPALFDR